MSYQQTIFAVVLSVLVVGVALVFELDFAQGLAAPGSSAPPSQVVSPNINVVNTPSVNVVNIPTVHVQEHNWQYRVIVIPKAIPGTPEWNDFLGQLTSSGQQGWELVNIVETVALLKKPS